ncbi:GPI-linked NAD(P)(+)--arginine ADP-ribosyltransferase 1-like [Onychostruthus taczanowskii]|uniref:GPI-linked NAD(P)(+)--arginine ADP-ribosyltransferase 1-like n=1 Tax=Onychostruthus taczanowskii TaxID=356909 RepID=UPI001B809D9B|nr:GPI-linked NAD(P)(+)--arginine ADP-ribosyltransferase 1-like [Onychostruthus taczanowskii]
MAPLAQTLALLAMTVGTAAITVVPLDMAQSSFDDQYLNCGPAMAEALPALNGSEFQENKEFSQVWVKATAEWQKRGSHSSTLSKDQAIALMAYTMTDVHRQFNAAVREAGRSIDTEGSSEHGKSAAPCMRGSRLQFRVPTAGGSTSCWRCRAPPRPMAAPGALQWFGMERA